MPYARNCNVLAMICGAANAAVYRAYAIRPYKWRKTLIAHPFQSLTKTIFDAGKTMSYVEKIMSDIIQTTSDLFRPIAII